MMHRNISVIMLIMASLFAKAQNFNTITRVVYEQQRISGYNSLNKLSAQVDCKDMVWQVLPDNSIKIWDDIHSFTVFSTTLTVPAFAALGDSLRAWQVSCGQSSTPFPTNLDTTHIDTSLIVPTLISNFSVNNNDTLSAILQTIKTIDVADTSNLWMINEVYNQLGLINARAYDTSQVDTSMIEPFIIESFSIRNNDTLSAILQELKKTDSVYVVNRDTAVVSVVGMKDTLKTLVFKAQTKRIDGTLDTLYNCKGLSFSVSENATGNIILYYGDGDQDVFDVTNESLPNWENGSFVEFLGFDASGIAGVLRVNMLGCSQTPDVVCAKEKPIVNCTSSTPIIICSGWASASGIWSTLSGCWNTGQ